jgi:hypothetical protein
MYIGNCSISITGGCREGNLFVLSPGSTALKKTPNNSRKDSSYKCAPFGCRTHGALVCSSSAEEEERYLGIRVINGELEVNPWHIIV